MRTYKEFSPQGHMFAKNLHYPKYLRGTDVPVPFGHEDYETLRRAAGPRNAKRTRAST